MRAKLAVKKEEETRGSRVQLVVATAAPEQIPSAPLILKPMGNALSFIIRRTAFLME
jgi:hypothetical protein